jgi:hypothetical protein
MTIQRVLTGISMLFVLALLVACGGGGGGGAAPVPPAPAPKVWGTAAFIETDNVGDAVTPQIAIDANGNALAVWTQSDGTRFNIWANRYTAASHTWGTAEPIETDNTGGADTPRIAIDANGNVLAVWHQSDGTRYNIWANRYTAATHTWGTAALIETGTGDAFDPQVAIDANGNALAVWGQLDGSFDSIVANRYTAATNSWGTAVPIENSAGHAAIPQIAIDANGNVLAVWVQDGDATASVRYDVWSSRYTATSSTWSTPTPLETDNTGDTYRPQIAIDANGNALAVWTQFDGTNNSIWANRYTTGTGWGTAALIETDNAGSAFSPQIAIDVNGNALAVWGQFDGTRGSIWSNRFIAGTGAGTGWGTAALIETDNAGSAYEPQIAVDTNGNALAVWSLDDGVNNSIWANRYTAATNTWGTAVFIETDNPSDAGTPQIAIDTNGNALAVWSKFDATRYNIWANRYQ